tara:strand:+ start:3128 stop:3394 length:267 start_codon:yes stop_codon:yes gene_type:complete
MTNFDYLRAFILRAKNRKLILEKLNNGEKTQAQLYNETNMYRTHVRRTLLELQEKRLVKCLNPKDRIYKIYVLTEKGKKVIKKLNYLK